MASRKSNGEGTLYQREDKTWVLQISTTDERGSSLRKSFTGKTKKIVKDKHKQFVEDQEQLKRKAALGLSIVADDISKQNISLSQWVFDWIQVYKKPPVVKATTYASYMQIWENAACRCYKQGNPVVLQLLIDAGAQRWKGGRNVPKIR